MTRISPHGLPFTRLPGSHPRAVASPYSRPEGHGNFLPSEIAMFLIGFVLVALAIGAGCLIGQTRRLGTWPDPSIPDGVTDG